MVGDLRCLCVDDFVVVQVSALIRRRRDVGLRVESSLGRDGGKLPMIRRTIDRSVELDASLLLLLLSIVALTCC